MQLLQDVRYGARQLRNSPGFTTVAVLSLALGIGANSAIFQLIDAIRLRPLPVAEPRTLARLEFAPKSSRSGWFSTRSAWFTSSMWDQLRRSAEPFSALIAWSADRFNLSPSGEARWAEGMYTSGNFFRVLGAAPVLGRVFTEDDDRPGCGAPGAVVSYAFWQREFAGDSAAVGRVVTLDGHRFPVIGVTAPGFFGVEVGRRYEVALPLCADIQKRQTSARAAWWISAMGRLKPGWSIERADAYMKATSPAFMQATLPATYRAGMAKRFIANRLTALPGATGVSGLREDSEAPLWLLLGATGIVLLIACGNVANLLLARASVREREMAIRQAIGGSRGRLIGQLLAESLLLAAIGTALGVAMAQAISRALIAFLTTSELRLYLTLSPDLRMMGFTAAVSTISCLVFGLLPAVRATRTPPIAAMRAGGRGLSSGRERFALRRALVAGQVALSLTLTVGALLFAGSLRKLLAVDAGFRADGLVTATLDLRSGHFSKERSRQLAGEFRERIAAVPGVISAAQTRLFPISGSGWDGEVTPEGSTGKSKESLFNEIGPGWLRTMGVGLVAGRDFDPRDVAGAPKVAIVNEEFAKTIFGGGNAVGRVFRVAAEAGKSDQVYQVVGLARNAKYYEMREKFHATAYFPSAQSERGDEWIAFVARVSGPARPALDGIKGAVASVYSGATIEFRSMSRQIEESLVSDRLMAALAGAFGILAGLLATIGLYGVIAYMVARRRNEIGIRVALGASRRSVVGMVIREAALLLAVGLAIGAGLTLWATRAAAGLLFGVKPNDPLTFAAAMALLAAVALFASYAPALRAARIEPMQALRED